MIQKPKPKPKPKQRPLTDLLRESEQAAWDALARGDFSAFGLAADTWVATWCLVNNPFASRQLMPPIEKNAFRELIGRANTYRSAHAPDYEGNQ